MPLEMAQQKLARGEIKPEDIPYMQRAGGSWDDSDMTRFGAKKKNWLKSDKAYAAGGWKKELSAGIFGGSQHEAWQKAWGVKDRNTGKTLSKDEEMWKAAGASFGQEKKGMFGRKAVRSNINDFKKDAPAKKA